MSVAYNDPALLEAAKARATVLHEAAMKAVGVQNGGMYSTDTRAALVELYSCAIVSGAFLGHARCIAQAVQKINPDTDFTDLLEAMIEAGADSIGTVAYAMGDEESP